MTVNSIASGQFREIQGAAVIPCRIRSLETAHITLGHPQIGEIEIPLALLAPRIREELRVIPDLTMKEGDFTGRIERISGPKENCWRAVRVDSLRIDTSPPMGPSLPPRETPDLLDLCRED